MKGLITTAILSAFLSHNPNPTMQTKPINLPKACPSITDIAVQGLDHVSPFIGLDFGNWMGVKENNNYNTSDSWTFIILGGSHTKNGTIALKEMIGLQSSLHLANGPEWEEREGLTACLYESNTSSPYNSPDFIGIAFSPSLYM